MDNDNEHNWLDIEDELYPLVLLSKLILVGNSPMGTLQIPIQVPYNTLHRLIDVTESLTQVITDLFGENKQEVLIFDQDKEKYIHLADFPFEHSVHLKGMFISSELINVKVLPINLQKDKSKSLKNILEKVGRWRKIYIESEKKVTLEEAAKIIGISRNTLDDYYLKIKSAEKYGFNFHENFDQPFQNLRKFVKERENKTIPSPLPHVLSKYQPK